ncbi:MAG: hypothetical protein ACI837_001371 [Crocinitomicaceae bacterium]|jgi:hypothetical protein
MIEAVNPLKRILYLLTLESRLDTLALLGAKSFSDKLAHAQHAFGRIFISKTLEVYLISTYNFGEKTLTWEKVIDEVTDCFDDETTLDQLKLADLKEKIGSDISWHLNELDQYDRTNLMYASVHFIGDTLKNQLKDLPEASKTPHFCELCWGTTEPKKFLATPDIIQLDEIFLPETSVLEKDQVRFSQESFDQNVEFFWNLGIREILAAEICAMSVFEYDNLPIDFYYDQIKQMWDEVRHANYYLEMSISLFPIAQERSKNERLLGIIDTYNKGGKLPVPKETNFAEAFRIASLTERLVLLNVRTEAPAVARLRKKMDSPFCAEFPEIKHFFSIDRNDEISHGAIGYKWLRFLYPDSETRKQVLNDVDSYRGLLLSTSIAGTNEEDFMQVLEKLAAK